MSAHPHIAQRRGNLVAAIAAIACCDIAMGLTLQLLPLLMDQRHVPAWIMGLNAAMSPLGIIIAGPFLPRLVACIGSKRLVYATTAMVVLSLLAFRLTPSLAAWFVIRFIFGLAAGTLFSISEAWILSSAEKGTRGRVMGLYTSILGVTFAVGPLIIPLTGIEGWLPWLIGIGFVCVSALPLAFVKVSEEGFRAEGEGFLGLIGRAPLLLFAVGTVTIFDAVMLSFFSIFGLRSGLALSTASWLLGVGIIGNALLQFPIGWLADRWSHMAVIVSSAAITAVLSVAMIWAIASWAIWPLILVLGTTAMAIYTVALTMLGERFDGSDLIAGSAAFGAMWGIGGIIGPPIAGAALDAFGPNAIPLSLAAVYVILLAGLAATGGKLIREPARA
jgi:MFS family permease